MYIISYSLFAEEDVGIYTHAASKYHARSKAKRGIAMLSVDKFPRGTEFISCSNNFCHVVKRFPSFDISDTTVIWPKSLCKHSVARSHRSDKKI